MFSGMACELLGDKVDDATQRGQCMSLLELRLE